MFPIGLQFDSFEKKNKNLSYVEPFNLEKEKDIINRVFGFETKKIQSKKKRESKKGTRKLH